MTKWLWRIPAASCGRSWLPATFCPPNPSWGTSSESAARSCERLFGSWPLGASSGVHHGIGTIVREPHDWNVLDPGVTEAFHESPQFPALVEEMLEARRAVEVQAAALAARHAVPEHRSAGSMKRWRQSPPRSATIRPSSTNRDIELHAAILEATENRFLYHALSPLFPLLRTVIRLSTQGSESDPVAYAAQSHAEIVAAITARGRRRGRGCDVATPFADRVRHSPCDEATP